MRQKTIKKEASITGYGIHTGKESKITICPAKEDTGIYFQRVDLLNKPLVKADFRNVVSTNRSTNIKKNQAQVNTIEHLMASISALEIDNLLIKINNIEVPILDGSSKPFTDLINSVGLKEQNKSKKYTVIKKKHVIECDKTDATYIVEPSDKYIVKVKLDYNKRFLKNQIAVLEDINKFEDEISSSRTFSFLDEVSYLIKNNLIKGGNLDNSVIIVNEDVSDDIKVLLIDKFGKENLTFDIGKLLNKKEFRFENEPARHKLLDFMGDSFLFGSNIKAKITCFKPGHKSNLEFVKKLSKIMNQENLKIAPEINFNEKPHYNLDDIKKFFLIENLLFL